MKLWQLQRQIKFIWQKATRGFSDDETWNLDYQLCKWLLPRLKRFQEFNRQNTGKQNTEDGDWHEIVDKMIVGVDFIVHDSDYLLDLSTEDYQKKEKEALEGLRLLGTYMKGLWW